MSVRDSLATMNSFECMWVDETKSEVIVAGEVSIPTHPPKLCYSPEVQRILSRSVSNSNKSATSKERVGRLLDARNEKKSKEEELRRHIHSVVTSYPSPTNKNIKNDAVREESKGGWDIRVDTPKKDLVDANSNDASMIVSTLSSNSYYEDDDAELTWRLHPSVSLSDWTIEVTTLQFGTVVSYPVHRSVLAVGPRRSMFFVREFKRYEYELKTVEAEKAKHLAIIETQKINQQQNDPMRHLQNNSVFYNNNSPFAKFAAGCSLIGAPLIDEPKNIQRETTLNLTDLANPSMSEVFVKPYNGTKVELEELAADALPAALDFIYSTNGFLDIKTEHCTALYYLSKKLEIKSLRKEVEKFWKGDLTIDTLTIYYHHSKLFNDASIIAAAELLCAQHLFELDDVTTVDLLSIFDPTFLYNVISITSKEAHSYYSGSAATSGRKQDDVENTKHLGDVNEINDDVLLEKFHLQLSLLIAVYCNIHRKELTPTMFWQLTDEKHLPIVDAKAAKSLLETQHVIVGPNNDLTSLTTRCISVLSNHWDETLSTHFGRLSLAIFEQEELDKLDTESSTPMNQNSLSKPSGSTSLLDKEVITDTSDIVIGVPKLCGDAMEEFVALALTNAKTQIIQLQTVNSMLYDQNDKVEQELALLRELALEEQQGMASTSPSQDENDQDSLTEEKQLKQLSPSQTDQQVQEHSDDIQEPPRLELESQQQVGEPPVFDDQEHHSPQSIQYPQVLQKQSPVSPTPFPPFYPIRQPRRQRDNVSYMSANSSERSSAAVSIGSQSDGADEDGTGTSSVNSSPTRKSASSSSTNKCPVNTTPTSNPTPASAPRSLNRLNVMKFQYEAREK